MSELAILRHLRPICGTHLLCYDGFFWDDEFYYLTTEYLGDDVRPLSEIIEKQGTRPLTNPLPSAIVSKMIDNLVIGLILIHAAGIAHRDIKPDNILANAATGEVRYIDFGLACYEEQCTTEKVGFTAAYAPSDVRLEPKQLSVYQSYDAWALGATIWELIDGTALSDVWAENAYESEESDDSDADAANQQFWSEIRYNPGGPSALDSRSEAVEIALRSLNPPPQTGLVSLQGLLSTRIDVRNAKLLALRPRAIALAENQLKQSLYRTKS
jgi:serine/threonine protein kinase